MVRTRASKLATFLLMSNVDFEQMSSFSRNFDQNSWKTLFRFVKDILKLLFHGILRDLTKFSRDFTKFLPCQQLALLSSHHLWFGSESRLVLFLTFFLEWTTFSRKFHAKSLKIHVESLNSRKDLHETWKSLFCCQTKAENM